MKGVFREKSLDKIASVDQLDKALKITSPFSWIALAGISVVLIAVIIWSFVGSLPTTITAPGIVVSSNTSTNTILSSQRGTVQYIISEGETVYFDTPILELSLGDKVETFYSEQVGIVSETLVQIGDTIDQRTEVLRVRPLMSDNQKEVVVCYVSVSDVGKIERGMDVNISLASADSNTYGYMLGRVINVDKYPTTQEGIAAVLGNDNNMMSTFNPENRSICAVTCELYTDPTSLSGYKWSTIKGKESKEIKAPATCSVRIVTERTKPITKLFSKLKDIWENK